jgi:hypothetical protein
MTQRQQLRQYSKSQLLQKMQQLLLTQQFLLRAIATKGLKVVQSPQGFALEDASSETPNMLDQND